MASQRKAWGQASRNRLGWVLYDWANSAFVLCIVTVIGAQYFLHVFEEAAKGAGDLKVGSASAMRVWGMTLPGEAMWSFIIAAAALFVVVTAPLLGSIADVRRNKKRFMQVYCLLGAAATVLLAWPLPWWAVGLLILVGTIGFEAGNVFYNAFLPEIAGAGEQDRLSSQGFAAGYVGGVLVLIAALVLFTPTVFNPPLGSIRNAFWMVGLWWGGFGLLTFALLQERPGGVAGGGLIASGRAAGRQLAGTLRSLRRYPQALLFLGAYLLYNDGIATLIANVTPYALQNIYVDDTLTAKIGTAQLILAIILVQVVAFPGSLFFGWLAGRIGQKATVFAALAVYTAVLLYGQVAQVAWQFFLMSGLIGWVLGGSQAISRSLFASFVPEGKNAEFFAFYGLSEKLSAMAGPLTYGLLIWLTGETRIAILGLTIFFVAGGLVLAFVKPERGRRQALAG
jgi:UMF1 family MFS transporter